MRGKHGPMSGISEAGSAEAFTGRTAWARDMAAALRAYLQTEVGSAVVLLAAAVVGLIWANLPGGSYETVWTTRLAVRLGGWGITEELRRWVNDGLMTFFFFVIGLEVRRELDMGELRERRRVAVPVLAALGGMVAPALIYLAINAGGPGARAWGVPMPTDTALALGVLALVGPRFPQRLRVFVLTLVVVDDIASLVVIGVAYTRDLSLVALAITNLFFGVVYLLRFLRFWRGPAYFVVGVALWAAMLESGVHPAVAGVAMGLLATAYPPRRQRLERAVSLTRMFREQPTPEFARSARLSVDTAISTNERLPDHHGRGGGAGGRQIDRHQWRLLAGHPAAPRRAAADGPLPAAGGGLDGRGDRLHGVAVHRRPLAGRPAPRGGQDRHPGRLHRGVAARLGHVPGDRAAPARAAGPHRRGNGAAPRRARCGRRRRARPRPRAGGGAGHPGRVRRLRVPVLRQGRADRPRAAPGVQRGAALRLSAPAAGRRAPPRRTGGRGRRGRRRPGELLGDARPAVRQPERARARRPARLRGATGTGRRPVLGRGPLQDLCAPRRRGRSQRRRERRRRYADLLRQRPPPRGRLRHRDARRRCAARPAPREGRCGRLARQAVQVTVPGHRHQGVRAVAATAASGWASSVPSRAISRFQNHAVASAIAVGPSGESGAPCQARRQPTTASRVSAAASTRELGGMLRCCSSRLAKPVSTATTSAASARTLSAQRSHPSVR